MAPTALEAPHSSSAPSWADCDGLRTDFTLSMSALYKSEVPLYGDLVRIVRDVNRSALAQALDPKVLAMRYGDVGATRLDIERHGAIRLGTPYELQTIRRVFALIGLHPVGYYDLSAAGLPMHATCFRPRTEESLHENPFRVFTSVLRPNLIRDSGARHLAQELLSKRNIFSEQLLHLLDVGDAQDGRLTVAQGQEFVQEAIKTFAWHSTAAATYEQYKALKAEHPILADIVCFRSSHINHLTPRTLDITMSQEQMKANGLRVKDRIEGPPPRSCPILLRQTSFLAVEEPIQFAISDEQALDSPLIDASHKARFGEIEERGAAVTPAGRKLYDDLLDEAMAAARSLGGEVTPENVDRLVEKVFDRYPDSWEEMRKRGLIYCSFQCTSQARRAHLVSNTYSLDSLVDADIIEALPITYEDFLPLSAAGIFQSNLGSKSPIDIKANPDVPGMEETLGAKLEDADDLYQRMQQQSIAQCEAVLGIKIVV